MAEDLNGDGFPDLATIGNDRVQVLWWRGLQDGGFTPPEPLLETPSLDGFTVAPVNGDQHPDLLLLEAGTLWLYYQQGDGSLRPGESRFIGGRPWQITLHDLNQDGQGDLLISGDGDSLTVWLQ